MRIYIYLFLFVIATSTVAQDEFETQWDQFRFTEYDKEVAAGLREVQQLLQGREALLQAYESTEQGMIGTQQEIEKLYQDRINTRKAALSYSENLVNFKFPDVAYEPIDTSLTGPDEEAEFLLWLSKMEAELLSNQLPPAKPPMFHIRSMSETDEGILVELDNKGDPIDALVSVTSGSSIISNPYQIELSNWDDPRYLRFGLLHRTDKVDLLIQSASGFLREQAAPSPSVISNLVKPSVVMN